MVVDLPGAREAGALDALRRGHEKAAVDGLILPTRPKLMDIRPLRQVIREEIVPIGVPFLVVLVRVDYRQLAAAEERRAERELHKKLKTFALRETEGASLAPLMRAAAVLMEQDKRFGAAAFKETKKQKGRQLR